MIANSSGCCADLIKSVECGLDLVVKHAAFWGSNQTIADPGKKREADGSLELHNASADGRLRYAKHFRCPRGRATPHDGRERLDLSKVHTRAPSGGLRQREPWHPDTSSAPRCNRARRCALRSQEADICTIMRGGFNARGLPLAGQCDGQHPPATHAPRRRGDRCPPRGRGRGLGAHRPRSAWCRD